MYPHKAYVAKNVWNTATGATSAQENASTCTDRRGRRYLKREWGSPTTTKGSLLSINPEKREPRRLSCPAVLHLTAGMKNPIHRRLRQAPAAVPVQQILLVSQTQTIKFLFTLYVLFICQYMLSDDYNFEQISLFTNRFMLLHLNVINYLPVSSTRIWARVVSLHFWDNPTYYNFPQIFKIFWRSWYTYMCNGEAVSEHFSTLIACCSGSNCNDYCWITLHK